jgi:type 1 glutamine amidotransferase
MAAAKKKRKAALIVWGGWDGHTPKECADVFAPWLESKGYRVVVSDSMDIYTNKRRMKGFNLIIPIWTMGEITGDQWKGLRDAIRGGAHVAGWHGGMCDSFRQNVDYQFMTGGQWVQHPGNIIRYKVNISTQKDPITKGLRDFSLKSEQYYMHTDPGNEVLATTTFTGRHGDAPWIKGTVMPVIWKRKYGKSRVFYTSLGHIATDFKVPEVLEIVKRGIMWAAGEKIVPEFKSKRKK